MIGGTTVLAMIIIMAVGTIVGWHARQVKGANADLKVHKARIPMFRKVRMRSSLVSAALVALTVLALRDLVR